MALLYHVSADRIILYSSFKFFPLIVILGASSNVQILPNMKFRFAGTNLNDPNSSEDTEPEFLDLEPSFKLI